MSSSQESPQDMNGPQNCTVRIKNKQNIHKSSKKSTNIAVTQTHNNDHKYKLKQVNTNWPWLYIFRQNVGFISPFENFQTLRLTDD